jgi:hypothetical protein
LEIPEKSNGGKMTEFYYKDNRWYFEYPDNLEFKDRGGGISLSLKQMEKIVAWANRKKKRIEKNDGIL